MKRKILSMGTFAIVASIAFILAVRTNSTATDDLLGIIAMSALALGFAVLVIGAFHVEKENM